MKAKYIFWGLLFITIGFLALLNNFTSIDIEWRSLWKLWPLVLIFWGISLMINSNILKSFIAGIIAVALGVSLYGAFKATFGLVSDGFEFSIDSDYEFLEKKFYTEPYDKDFSTASLDLKVGAGVFVIKDTSFNLFQAEVEGSKMNYTLSRTDVGNNSDIEFKMNKAHFTLKNGKMKNYVEIKLNPNPVWDLDIDIGAAEVNFDLRSYKLNNIDIETGAAAVKIKLGELSEKINLNLDAGAADVDIFIPENSGCEIKTRAPLSSKNFDGFKEVSNNLYRTDNFDSSSNKIYMTLDAGISSLSVKRESGW